MAALVLADLVAVLHMAFLVYMVLGGFLALRRFGLIWPHIATVVYAAYVTLASYTCPATRLEKWLLAASGETPYEGSFIAQYLHGTVFPAEYEKAVWLACIGIAIASYTWAFVRLRRRFVVPDAGQAGVAEAVRRTSGVLRTMRAGDENRTRTVSLGS